VQKRLEALKSKLWGANDYERSVHNLLIASSQLVKRREQWIAKNEDQAIAEIVAARPEDASRIEDFLQAGDMVQLNALIRARAGIGRTTLWRDKETRQILQGSGLGKLDQLVWLPGRTPHANVAITSPVLAEHLDRVGATGEVSAVRSAEIESARQQYSLTEGMESRTRASYCQRIFLC